MKRITLILAGIISITLLATSCKTREKAEPISKVTGDVEIALPFTGAEYQSNDKFFRAINNGISIDLSTAKKIALLNAKRELQLMVESKLKVVVQEYTNQKQIALDQELGKNFNDEVIDAANGTMNDLRVIGEKVYKAADGKFTYWIAIEMPKDALSNAACKRLSQNAKTQLSFDEYQFKKIFDEEMKKFEEGR